MKDSKEKEHRISNLKNMIDHVNDDGKEFEGIEEDSELIDYLNEDTGNYEELEIDDEFIYRPSDDEDYAVNLEENPIDEDFIIKTPKADGNNDNNDEAENLNDELMGDVSENFDNVIHAQIGGKPVMAIISLVLGAILIILSIFILDSRSDRVIDNVVSGETNFIFIIFFIIGLLLLLYGVIKVFRIKNPFESLTKSIDSIDDENKKNTPKPKNKEPSAKAIPKSNIPLDKESYKIGEFNMGDLKESLKKPTSSKNNKTSMKENLDDIPPAKRSAKKKPTDEEPEDMDYIEVKHDEESIDDIFAEVEDIDEMPIISIDSKEKKK